MFVDIEGERGWGTQQGQAGSELAVLADDLPMSDAIRDRELAAIERARSGAYMAASVGKQLVALVRQLGVTFTDAEEHPSVLACRATYAPGRAMAQ
jgi:hypothetical protein